MVVTPLGEGREGNGNIGVCGALFRIYMSAADALQVWGTSPTFGGCSSDCLRRWPEGWGPGAGSWKSDTTQWSYISGNGRTTAGFRSSVSGGGQLGRSGHGTGVEAWWGARLWPVEAVGAATDVRRQSTIGPVSGQSQPPLLAQSPGHPPPQKPCQASPTPKLPSRWQTRDGTGVGLYQAKKLQRRSSSSSS